jgi:cytochrome c biogenesis protein CcmG, thiol:disulfide interchange protein DsbE
VTARGQWSVVAAVLAILAGGLWAATHFLGDELFPVVVGSDAPGFSAATLDAAPRVKTLTDYRGKVVLLNIWATWCGPCRTEMPSMEALHQEFAPRGLKVVAVSIDDAGQEQAIRDFVREYALSFEVLHDASGAIQRIYQTTGVPETMVIGADGVIRKKVIGASEWNSPANRKLVDQLLTDAGAPPAGVPSTDAPAGATVPARR